jgi:hypothetical protein
MKKLIALVIFIAGAALAGAQNLATLIRLTTTPEDAESLVVNKLPDWLNWLIGQPWWVADVILFALLALAVWLVALDRSLQRELKLLRKDFKNSNDLSRSLEDAKSAVMVQAEALNALMETSRAYASLGIRERRLESLQYVLDDFSEVVESMRLQKVRFEAEQDLPTRARYNQELERSVHSSLQEWNAIIRRNLGDSVRYTSPLDFGAIEVEIRRIQQTRISQIKDIRERIVTLEDPTMDINIDS